MCVQFSILKYQQFLVSLVFFYYYYYYVCTFMEGSLLYNVVSESTINVVNIQVELNEEKRFWKLNVTHGYKTHKG